MPDPSCSALREDLSAALDNELDRDALDALQEHLATCVDCRRHERDLRRVRQVLRVQAATPVPDLVDELMDRIRLETAPRPSWWPQRLRVAGVAAVAAALLMLGVIAPWGDDPADVARAEDISQRVQAAARTLESYHARFDMIERGWHPSVPLRDFEGEVWFDGPESLRLEIDDRTIYPRRGGWPENDITLVSAAARWSLEEPSSCPVEALPGCGVQTRAATTKSLVRRQPFDGTSVLPTDIILPVETLALSDTFTVLGPERLLDRPVTVLRMPYRQAQPLIHSLQPGGSWRPFRSLDSVELWVDDATLFPLRVAVYPQGKRVPVLEVTMSSFEEPGTLPRGLFEVRGGGIRRDGGFAPLSFAEAQTAVPGPDYIAELRPYRAGTAGGRTILSFTQGLRWLKVSFDPRASTVAPVAEPLELGRAGIAYYQPADATLRRRIDLYTREGRVTLQSNLPRGTLLRVARSIPAVGRPIDSPLRTLEDGLDDLAERGRFGFVRLPRALPEGYSTDEGLFGIYAGRTVTIYYRQPEVEFDGLGIRLTQAASIKLLPPPSGESQAVRIGDGVGRWTAPRGELEWIDDGIYRSISAPSFDVATVVAIAESLR